MPVTPDSNTSEGRRRKRSAEEAESAESLLIWTRATDVGDRENHGKLACLLEKIGTEEEELLSGMTGMWGYVLWAGRGDVPPSAPRDDRTRESGTKESFAMETTVLPRPYLALRRGRPGLWSRLSKAQIPGKQAG